MKKFIPVLKRTKLFAGIGEDEILSMLSSSEQGFVPIKRVNMCSDRASI